MFNFLDLNHRLLVISIIFFLLFNTGLSQGFGNVGTAWKHCLTPGMEPGNNIIQIESEDSTSFQGLPCRILRSADFQTIGTSSVDSMLVCNSGDTVYYVEGDSLFLLYNFSLLAGDQYQIKFPVEISSSYELFFPEESLYWNIYIDSVDFFEIDGVMLRRQHIHYLDNERESLINLGDWAMERIGYQTWIFPFLSFGETNPDCQLFEFSDGQIQYIDSLSFCTTSSIEHIQIDKESITLWPNPISDLLRINSDKNIEQVHLTSMQGETLKLNRTDAEIDFTTFPCGLYFLSIVTIDGLMTYRLVKL